MKAGGFMKDAITLFLITLISGICLGAVYEITKDPIAAAEAAAQQETYREVYADAAQFVEDEALDAAVQAFPEALAASGLSLGNVSIESALQALDSSGNPIGYVVSAASGDGYGGTIRVSVGITGEGMVTGIGFLEIAETPGLGMNADTPEFKAQFAGKTAEQFAVTKNGASADNEIDAITSATITSTAVTNAVNAALFFAADCIA